MVLCFIGSLLIGFMCASLPCCLCLIPPAVLAIRLCQRLVQVGQPTHPHFRQDAQDARKRGGSGDQIALKDGKCLLVVQYIWRGPSRPPRRGETPAKSEGNRIGQWSNRQLRRR